MISEQPVDSKALPPIALNNSQFDSYSPVMNELEYLKTKEKSLPMLGSQVVRVVDMFCGCGGLSLGCMEAAYALRKRFDPLLAIDNDPDAFLVYDANFHPKRAYCCDVSKLFDGNLGSPATATETGLSKSLGAVDMLLAGPPCQGHSD